MYGCCLALGSSFVTVRATAKAVLHVKSFLQLVSQRLLRDKLQEKLPRVTPQFCNLQRQQNVALRVVRKVEISSTFRNVARKVALCGMSIATCNAIL